MKLMIALPTADYCHVNFAMSLVGLVSTAKDRFLVSLGHGSNVCQSRNLLVHMAKDAEVEFMLFIDDDMSYPPDIADRMVGVAEKRGIDVIGCNYPCKAPPHKLTVVRKEHSEPDNDGLEEVDLLPTGMMLIRMRVFGLIDQPYFYYPPMQERGFISVSTEDYQFCERLRDKGVRMWMDTKLSSEVAHWGGPIGVRWTSESPGYQYVSQPR